MDNMGEKEERQRVWICKSGTAGNGPCSSRVVFRRTGTDCAQTEVVAQPIAVHVGQTDDDRYDDAKLTSVKLLVTVRESGDAADTVCRQSQVDTKGFSFCGGGEIDNRRKMRRSRFLNSAPTSV